MVPEDRRMKGSPPSRPLTPPSLTRGEGVRKGRSAPGSKKGKNLFESRGMRWAVSVGCVAAIVVTVVFVRRWQEASELSAHQVQLAYDQVREHYEDLLEAGMSDVDMAEFEKEALARLEPVVASLEQAAQSGSLEMRLYYQVGKYDIPKILRNREPWEIPRMDQAYQLWTQRPKEEKASTSHTPWFLDPVILGMGGFDIGMIVWMVRINRRWHWETRLRYLDRKFANQPDSVKYRSQRARLRAALGDREGALSDIAWLMERAPPGVDLKSLRALRDSLGEQ